MRQPYQTLHHRYVPWPPSSGRTYPKNQRTLIPSNEMILNHYSYTNTKRSVSFSLPSSHLIPSDRYTLLQSQSYLTSRSARSRLEPTTPSSPSFGRCATRVRSRRSSRADAWSLRRRRTRFYFVGKWSSGGGHACIEGAGGGCRGCCERGEAGCSGTWLGWLEMGMGVDRKSAFVAISNFEPMGLICIQSKFFVWDWVNHAFRHRYCLVYHCETYRRKLVQCTMSRKCLRRASTQEKWYQTISR